MAVCPTPVSGKEDRPFVDREEFIEAFETAFQNIGNKNYSVLVYYGIGGIGKTSLRKELPKKLDEHNEPDQKTGIIWATVDFSIESHRQMDKFLGILKNELNQKCGVKFHLFDIAHAAYRRKVDPYTPLSKDGYSEDSIVTDLLDSFGGFFSINYSSIKKVVERAPDHFKEWSLKRENDIARLPDMEAPDIVKKLPVFFAHDLADYLQKTSKSTVIFIDSYEALWEKERGQGSYNSRDEWIRQLIANLQKLSLWVICGREKLRWEETDKDWNNYLEQYKLEKLPLEDALDFLNRCGIKEEEIQKVIIEGSEGVPYYLELAVDTYTEIAKTSSPKPSDFGTTRSEIFDRFMKYLGVPEKETLKVLSTPRFWNQDIFKALINNFNTGYPLTAFSELNRFSFVQETEGKLQLHPLMRESLQVYQDQDLKKEVHNFMLDFYSNKIKDLDIKSINPEHETAFTEAFYHAKETLETEELFEWFIRYVDPFDKAAFWQLIIPMYEELLKILETKQGSENIEVATTLNNLATLYRHVGEYKKSLSIYKRTLEIIEKVQGTQDKFVAATQNNLATLYYQMGEYEKALPLHKQALGTLEKVLGLEHPAVAHTLDNLGVLYCQTGKYEKALPLYQQALEIQEKVLGPQHSNFAETLNNLAALYHQIGEYEKALPLYQQALEIREKVLGQQHPYVATILNNLAELHRQMGEYERALPLYSRSLEINEKVLGPEHPNISILCDNLALLYMDKGIYDQALSLYEKSLSIRIEIFDDKHPDLARSFNNLAELYERLGEYEKSISLFEKGLDISKNILGEDHIEVVVASNGLAGLYANLKYYSEALSIYEKNARILKNTVGKKNPQFAITLNDQALVHQQMGNCKKAFSLYNEALEIQKETLGLNHKETATTLNNLAALHASREEYQEALPLYNQALEIREKVLGLEHPLVSITLNNLAELYRQMGKYEKALPLYHRALEIIEKVLGKEHPDFVRTLNNLATFYHQTGEYEKALQLYEQSLEIREKILGLQHPEVAISLVNLADFYDKNGKYDEAIHSFEKALDIIENTLGPDHPFCGQITYRLISIYGKM
ncbi:hypothetical protein MSMTP_1824 [Methanosarcina sp. MTP4]|uniref:tetratricopeptide repeat protein n=1 Tax=Methanosarcina sp. MTP4 TaxID=1434100 RepID=UPI000615718D|nr:tetratricopeptide repeat protein [Methanosarcina sp. MTP4]AKB25293.1 hypothetical protein MSMTP_1824 [Methanosarcina sp. MTP4]